MAWFNPGDIISIVNYLYRFLYLGYITVWLLNEYKYLGRIDYSMLVGNENYALINELIIGNLLFGAIGIAISLLIVSSQKTWVYFIWTCTIGLAIAIATLYLDAAFTNRAAQAHVNSVLALFLWLLTGSLSTWRGIFKDLGTAIFNRKNKRKD
jgi:hypothetical protein